MTRSTNYRRHCVVLEEELGLAYGIHTLRQLFSFISCDMVFDVGAHVGQYALQLRRYIGYRGPIVSFEPLPEAADQLRTQSEGDQNWQIKECVLNDTDGSARLHRMAGDQFSSLLLPAAEFEGLFFGQHRVKEVIDVPSVTLTSAVRAAPKFSCGLLKLDTQGSELRILRADESALQGFAAIQIEVGFQSIYDGAPQFDEIVAAMNSFGYRMCGLFPNNAGHFPHLLEMDAIFLRSDRFPDLS